MTHSSITVGADCYGKFDYLYQIWYIMAKEKDLKQLDFIGSSREDLKEFPEEVRQDIGYALFEA